VKRGAADDKEVTGPGATEKIEWIDPNVEHRPMMPLLDRMGLNASARAAKQALTRCGF
jgi:hypothetical protein